MSGIALEGEIFSKLTQHYGEGRYQVRIFDGESCRVSTAFEYIIPEFENTERVSICQGDTYEFGESVLAVEGIYVDTFKTKDNCANIVTLDLSVVGAKYDTTEVCILEGEKYDIEEYSLSEIGDYSLILTSSLGCDSLVLLKLTHFNVYIPNVFSPNQDGVNDFFGPIAQDGKIVSVNMSIYDRWGSKLYQGSEWDGYSAVSGVYVYVMEIDFVFQESKTFFGAITVLK